MVQGLARTKVGTQWTHNLGGNAHTLELFLVIGSGLRTIVCDEYDLLSWSDLSNCDGGNWGQRLGECPYLYSEAYLKSPPSPQKGVLPTIILLSLWFLQPTEAAVIFDHSAISVDSHMNDR